jgi:heme/copper-type cytochrome/quinol oxidase subunit 2
MTASLPIGTLSRMWMAAEQEPKSYPAIVVVLIVLVVAGVIYLFGYVRAIMHRANKDYKATKAAVKPLRKAFWLSWWTATKVGFWILIAGALLVSWVVHDVRESDATTPQPSATPSRSRR